MSRRLHSLFGVACDHLHHDCVNIGFRNTDQKNGARILPHLCVWKHCCSACAKTFLMVVHPLPPGQSLGRLDGIL